MKDWLITVDCGTTNTRASLWNREGVCVGLEKEGVGVRDTAVDGNNLRLKAGVKACLERLLSRRGVRPDAVAAVYASGMITSDVGLVVVPHLTAPAGRDDFVRGVVLRDLPEVFPLPFHFIPGLKNLDGGVRPDNVESMDIMRGEETETLALQDLLPAGREYLFVLPGSHTKFVAVDKAGRMTGCLTSLAGELLSLLTTQSILADAVGRRFVGADEYRRDVALAGCRVAARTGLARTAFTTRIMNLFMDKDPVACANFLLGAVLQSDVAAAKGSAALSVSGEAAVVVAGKEPLRSALADVFEADGMFRAVQRYEPPEGLFLSGYGALGVAVARGDFGGMK